MDREQSAGEWLKLACRTWCSREWALAPSESAFRTLVPRWIRAATSDEGGVAAGDIRIRAGRESGDFLMPDMQALNAAMAPQCIGKAVQAVARDSVDALDARGGEVSTIWSATVLAVMLSSDQVHNFGPDDSGSSGSDRGPAGAGTDLRGRLGKECQWLGGRCA
jgi:hypothetical protein